MAHEGRQLSAHGLGYDDVNPGDWFDTPRRIVTITDIEKFADLSGDRFEIHMSDAAAQEFGFPSRVAHGLPVLSIVDGLKNNSKADFKAIASLGWDWKFEAPVLAGDELHARITVLSKRKTSVSGRAILQLGFSVQNHNGVQVQSGENLLMIQC